MELATERADIEASCPCWASICFSCVLSSPVWMDKATALLFVELLELLLDEDVQLMLKCTCRGVQSAQTAIAVVLTPSVKLGCSL